MGYRKQFDPQTSRVVEPPGSPRAASGDRRDGLVYVYTDEIILHVNVALATKRPLLVRGPSGSGKSSMARNVALHLGWRYYEDVISSATQARDLLWRFDSLRRFSDAQVENQLKPNAAYVEPGVLWWAFDPTTARRRGVKSGQPVPAEAVDPARGGSPEQPAVVLLDEIDKADPDVPNNLLVPVGSHHFFVTETATEVNADPSRVPLLIITSNNERELPTAFLRRCIPLELPAPDEDRLIEIARQHFGRSTDNDRFYRTIAACVPRNPERDYSTAEFLDTIRACLQLGIQPDPKDQIWQAMLNSTMVKRTDGQEQSR
jgi:MoxR-like ATPase